MVYLLNKLDFELFEFDDRYTCLDLFQTKEERVQSWIKNERTRTIFSKQEIVNLFQIKEKVQITHTDKIKLKKGDKVIVWTTSGKYFVLKVTGFV